VDDRASNRSSRSGIEGVENHRAAQLELSGRMAAADMIEFFIILVVNLDPFN
jgi:hypothetical protein